MSTICKLDPRVRSERSRRRDLVQTLFREARDPRRPPANRLAVDAIAYELDRIRKFSARTGADKEARFKVVINRPTFQSPL